MVTEKHPCRLYEVGTWREVRQIEGAFLCFSPDRRLGVVYDINRALRLVELTTGHILARFESPDQHGIGWATFTPDGSRLIVTTNDPPSCEHIWDLRVIRRQLAGMGLDWDAPAFSADDPARADLPPLPPFEIDYGPLLAHTDLYSERPQALLERYSARIAKDHCDAEAFHMRGHTFLWLDRFEEALADFSAALALKPRDNHLLAYGGMCLFNLKRYAPALDQLEAASQIDQQSLRTIYNLQTAINKRAWELANGVGPERDSVTAVRLAALAVALAPDDPMYLNTLGVSFYRAERFPEAIETLEKSHAAGMGQFDALDLLFLAMAHHRLGHRELARQLFDRALEWLKRSPPLGQGYTNELTAFRTEAESVLAGPAGEMPENVIAPPQQ
jgi:tetratricopeptide (TPR) repeat protein